MKLWEKTALILALASIATQLIGSYLQVSKKLLTKILLGVAAFAILAFSILITVDVISKRETTESTNRETATPSAAATATVTVAPIEKMSTPTFPAYQPSPVLPTQTADLVENRQ